MAVDDTQQAAPSEIMRALSRLVGTWRVAGGASGTVTYEYLDGEHFLVQRVELEQFGQRVSGIEVIGHLHPFGEQRSDAVHSRFFDNQGNTFDYVYELDGDTLWIWAGEKGSPAYYTGTFEDAVLTGTWTYPGGGGYDSVMTRTDGSM